MSQTKIKLPNRCVYVMFRQNAEPFYIGKGAHSRAEYDHIRDAKSPKNTKKLNVIRKLLRTLGEVPTVIIRDGLSDEEASDIEIALIAAIGREDLGKGPLLNLTDGGDGVRGYRPTPFVKEKTRNGLLAAFAKPEVIEKCVTSGLTAWRDPLKREKRLIAIAQSQAKPEVIENHRIARAEPGFKEKHLAGIRKSREKESWAENQRTSQLVAQNRPDVKLKKSDSNLKTWSDPVLKLKQSLRQTDAMKRPGMFQANREKRILWWKEARKNDLMPKSGSEVEKILTLLLAFKFTMKKLLELLGRRPSGILYDEIYLKRAFEFLSRKYIYEIGPVGQRQIWRAKKPSGHYRKK